MHTSPRSSPLEDEIATRNYYDYHAQAYVEATLRIDMRVIYDRFLKHIRPRGRILDAGSGSGRDTLAFLERGYEVEAFDSSPTLCALSTRLTGIQTRLLRFQDFESLPRYDGIWACASLLHVPKEDLQDAVGRLIRALNPNGALYVSFKKGSGERMSDDGRFYLDLDEPSLRRIFANFQSVRLVDVWVSGGEGAKRGKDEWLNAIGLRSSDKGRDDGQDNQ
jgi:SAM-dependent methyltransferase